MDYIVKCAYCGGTYIVNSKGNNAHFSCNKCGALNGTEDIIETSTLQSQAKMDKTEEDVHFEYYLKAAEQGDVKAQYKVAVYYDEGKGVAQDLEKAEVWYTKAAEQGHASAQYNLGNSYYHGEGVKRDETTAVSWYRKAADQGHAKAQFMMGVCYDKGLGVVNDEVEAVCWYRKAAEQGHAKAQAKLIECNK